MRSPSSSGRSRTVLLSVVVVLAVIVLGLVGFLVFGRASSSDDASHTGPATTTRTTAPTSETTASSSTSSPTRTTPTVAPGSVTYQLTGSGEVVGLAYRNDSGRVVIAATGSPWSNKTTASDRNVELTAVVVRGPVTCTILQGEELISSSTSSGGPLRCAGKLPR